MLVPATADRHKRVRWCQIVRLAVVVKHYTKVVQRPLPIFLFTCAQGIDTPRCCEVVHCVDTSSDCVRGFSGDS